MCGSWGKGSHLGSRGAWPPRRGKRLAVGSGQWRRRDIARWPKTQETGSPHLQEMFMHRVSAIVQLYSITITGIMFYYIICFRKINHLVLITICIHPLMYGKLCRAQLGVSSSPLCLGESIDWQRAMKECIYLNGPRHPLVTTNRILADHNVVPLYGVTHALLAVSVSSYSI